MPKAATLRFFGARLRAEQMGRLMSPVRVATFIQAPLSVASASIWIAPTRASCTPLTKWEAKAISAAGVVLLSLFVRNYDDWVKFRAAVGVAGFGTMLWLIWGE